jgi:hypothetical protein
MSPEDSPRDGPANLAEEIDWPSFTLHSVSHHCKMAEQRRALLRSGRQDSAKTGHRRLTPRPVGRPLRWHHGRQLEQLPHTSQFSSMAAPRRRKAFPITEAELKLIASAAIMGDSSHPVNG